MALLLGAQREKALDYVSCAPATLYRGGGFFDQPELLTRLSDPGQTPQGECRMLAEVFPPFSVCRPPPALLSTTDAVFRGELERQMPLLNTDRQHGAASALVCLDSGFLHSNVLYTRSVAGVRAVFETHRANDRPYVPRIDPLSALYPHEPMSDSQVIDLFIGSAGTGNYGHWLVDDLPRTAAVATLRREAGRRPIRIWLSDAGEPMNSVRTTSLHLTCEGLGPLEVRIAHLDRIYDFKRLHYVTPVSYHPVLKSPDALRWVAERYARLVTGKRLFVRRRPERTRGLQDMTTVSARLQELGFEPVEAEGLSFEQQAELFAEASVVIGCMGAAMTNTLFCRPGTQILYLAPEGWVEPFYWDLAAMRGHPYYVVYGPLAENGRPAHLSSYTIGAERLEAGLAALGLS